MAEEERSRKLVLRLSDEEWESIRRAAEREGFDEVEMPVWVRESFLEHLAARSGRAAAVRPPVPSSASTPPSKAPHCSCGLSQDPDGHCDGSCIMRI